MTVGELRELIAGLPDDTPIVGLDPVKRFPTEDVDVHVGRAVFENRMEMDPAVLVTIG